MTNDELWTNARKIWEKYICKEIVFVVPNKLQNVSGYCWEGAKTKKGFIYTGKVLSVNVWGGMVVVCVSFRLLNGDMHHYNIPITSIVGIYEQTKRLVCELVFDSIEK